MDTLTGWQMQAFGALGSIISPSPASCFQTNTCSDIPAHKSVTSEHKAAGSQPAQVVLVRHGLAFISQQLGKALVMLHWSLVSHPACANHPFTFFWDQRRALGSLNPPQWFPEWCHASKSLLETGPELSCRLHAQPDLSVTTWSWDGFESNSCLIWSLKSLASRSPGKLLKPISLPDLFPAPLCSLLLLSECHLPEIPTFIKCDTTLQIKSSCNEKDQNHLPTLKAQAGPQRS